MALLAKAGTASLATTTSAVTQPTASSRAIGRGSSGGQPSRTNFRASARGIMPGLSGLALARGQVGEQATKAGPEVRTLQGQLDVGPQVVQPVAGVVSAPAEDVPVDGLLVQEQPDRVGQLELPALARLHPVDGIEIGRASCRERV